MLLFFEDEMLLNHAYVVGLELGGYEVHVEPEPAAAVEFFRAHGGKIELVIIDVMAPLKKPFRGDVDPTRARNGLRSGAEVLRLINSTDAGKAVPKLILTNVGVAELEDIHRFAPGIKGCHAKNATSPRQLLELVRAALRR